MQLNVSKIKILHILFALSLPLQPLPGKEVPVAALNEAVLLVDEDPDYEAMQLQLDELRRAEEELEQQRRERKVTGEEYEQRRQSLFGRLASLMMLADRGSFLLEGEVVDEHGNPLSGVRLEFTKERMTGLDREVSRTEKSVVNGQFSVRARGYTDVGLIFSKPGYYSYRMRFPQLTLEEDEELEEEFERGRIRPRRYEHRNLRVEMHSIGEIAGTLSLRYQPRVYTQSDGVKYRLRSFKTIPQPGTMNVYFSPEQRVHLGVDEMPEAAIFLAPALDHSGRILPLENDNRFPAEVTLVLNAEEGGFLLHERGAPEKGFWSMEEAPEEGYQRALRIDGGLLHQQTHDRNNLFRGVFFYFKVGEIYGKANIRHVNITDGGNTFNSTIEMFFQPDGTRFLRTRRGHQ